MFCGPWFLRSCSSPAWDTGMARTAQEKGMLASAASWFRRRHASGCNQYSPFLFPWGGGFIACSEPQSAGTLPGESSGAGGPC